MKHFVVLDLPTFEDARGSLTVVDKILPFQVKRSYWVYKVDENMRGGHRHKNTWQALVAVTGRVDVYMCDSFHEETIKLEKPNQCLLVEPKDWHTMTIYNSSVLLVMASSHFEESDYVSTPYEPSKND